MFAPYLDLIFVLIYNNTILIFYPAFTLYYTCYFRLLSPIL